MRAKQVYAADSSRASVQVRLLRKCARRLKMNIRFLQAIMIWFVSSISAVFATKLWFTNNLEAIGFLVASYIFAIVFLWKKRDKRNETIKSYLQNFNPKKVRKQRNGTK